ncbi:MAG: bifunctional nuclease family protein [Thermodesulfobacteriota bacterium]
MKHRFIFKLAAVSLVVFIFSSPVLMADSQDSLKEMEIKGIAFDKNLQTPVVFLTDLGQNKILPIWIGICEARSIELSLSDVLPPRPLTYDFIAAMVRTMNAKVERIVVVDLRDEVFYAQVELTVDGKISKIDARPSDAIALAARVNAPIFVKQSVIDKAALLDPNLEKRGL